MNTMSGQKYVVVVSYQHFIQKLSRNYTEIRKTNFLLFAIIAKFICVANFLGGWFLVDFGVLECTSPHLLGFW